MVQNILLLLSVLKNLLLLCKDYNYNGEQNDLHLRLQSQEFIYQ